MDTPAKTNLLDFDRAALREYFAALGEKPFRAEQVLQWVHQYGVDDFDAMSNVSKALREWIVTRPNCCGGNFLLG